LSKANAAAEAAVRSDDAEAWAYWARAGCAIYAGQYDRAITALIRAVDLNPNDADVLADAGLYFAFAGRADEAIEFALRAMRINPHFPEYYSDQLGQIYFMARRYDEAIRVIEGIQTLDTPSMCVYLAASHAQMGHEEAARAIVRHLLEIDPQATVARWTSQEVAPYREEKDREHLRAALKCAGLPQ
jgi:adenylate cyclase